jgi:hypothetical protein
MHAKPLLRIIATSALIMLFVFGFNSCRKEVPSDGANLPPYYNLDVTLFPESGKMDYRKNSSGFIKFRQDSDTGRVITLNTYVINLEPNHAYLLQRAVNPITDSSCTSTAWLTLGLGLAPQAIHTDSRGTGHEALFRNLPATTASGTQFRIHFQIIDSLTSTPVLSSDCYEYTAK